MDQFVTVDNMKLCEAVFQRYMRDKFNVPVVANDPRVRRVIWRIMQDVRSKPPAGSAQMSLRELNDMALNIARDVWMSTHSSKRESESQSQSQSLLPPQSQQIGRPPPMPNKNNMTNMNVNMNVNMTQAGGRLTSLDRDQALFGDSRPLAVNTLLPTLSLKEPEDAIKSSYDRLMSERKSAEERDPAEAQGWKPEKVDKVGSDQFDTMMQELERLRNWDVERFDDAPPAASQAAANNNQQQYERGAGRADPVAIIRAPDDPAVLFRTMQGDGKPKADEDDVEIMSSARRIAHTSLNKDENDINMQILQRLPKEANRRVVYKYLSINSFDRDWVKDPFRYTYTVTFAGYGENDAQNHYRNVTAISVSTIVLPMEIRQVQSLNVNLTDKSEYMNDYSFNYPYIMLAIDGIDDVYDGTNDRVRRAFCLMIYKTAYRTKNGRGYIVLEPMQEEKKLFYPVPLGSLKNMRLTLIRPNGAVLNNSTDDYLVSKVEHEDYNPTYLRIVLDKFFDKNDYFVGDLVLFRGYEAKQLLANAPTEGAAYKRVNDFINRTEGHEIVESGQVNDNGFYRTFYIMAPGTLDKATGRLSLDYTIINTINSFNAQQQEVYGANPTGYDAIVNGAVCNGSLQNTIAFTLWYEIFDAKIDVRTQ